MRLPSIWLVVCFAGGVLLSGKLALRLHLTPRAFLIAAPSLLIVGFLALHKNWIVPAAIVATAAWLCLGCAAASLERVSVPVNLASSLIESGKLDSSVALRWRGQLRADPLALPWGTRYEMQLDEVESATGVLPVAGGLRLTSYGDRSSSGAIPLARAGDRVEVLAHANLIRNFGNPGSFDERGYLVLQGIHLQGTLRNDRLLTVLDHPRLTISNRLARLRGDFLRSIDDIFASRSEQAALARAMLLGDRSFVERDRVLAFQQTGVYHVLVLAGLHVGALTAFFIWAGRRLRLSLLMRTILTLTILATYVGIVEDRPPILRAALMATLYLSARLLYRRMDLLNVAALAALGILIVRPSEIVDSSFLLSFSAVGIIGALAVPWITHSSEPYLHGTRTFERCWARCIACPTCDSISNRNSRCGSVDWGPPSATGGAIWTTPPCSAAAHRLVFLGFTGDFHDPSTRNACPACVLLSPRYACGPLCKYSRAPADGIDCPLRFFHIAGFPGIAHRCCLARKRSRGLSLDSWNIRGVVCPVAPRELPDTGAAADSDCGFRRHYSTSFQRNSVAAAGIAMDFSGILHSHRGADRDASLRATSHKEKSRIDRAGCRTG